MPTPFDRQPEAVSSDPQYEYDFFISYANEDKESFVQPLAEALKANGAKVWWDEFELNVGDSLHEAISKGLGSSRSGIVVLSPAFFRKTWTKRELNGLLARVNDDATGNVLPIWHGVTQQDVYGFSPILAGIVGLVTADLGLDEVVERILARLSVLSRPALPTVSVTPGNHIVHLDRLAEESVQRWQRLVNDTPIDSPTRLPHGSYEMAFTLNPTPNRVRPNDVLERINEAGKKELTGYPPFMVCPTPEWRPYPSGDFVEAWLGNDSKDINQALGPDSSDFWRASKDGELYTINGYTEDRDDSTAGRVIYVEVPIFRVAEGLTFARRYANLFNGVEAIGVRLRFNGLSGRKLTMSQSNLHVGKATPSRTDDVVSHALVPCTEIGNSLPDVVITLLANLYEQFGFFELKPKFVQDVLPDHFAPMSN